MTTKKSTTVLRFPVLEGTCLGHKAFRGFASLTDIAKISKADIFDQNENRSGTQRNLSLTHARRAHQYVQSTQGAFYPEAILNIRDKSYVRFHPIKDLGNV